MVDGSIARLTLGNRRVPHRGVRRNDAWLQLRIVGLNLRRMLALGLTVQKRAWALGSSTAQTRPIHKTTG